MCIFMSVIGIFKCRFNILPLLMSLELLILSSLFYLFLSMGSFLFFGLSFIVISSLIGLMLMVSGVMLFGSDKCLSLIA